MMVPRQEYAAVDVPTEDRLIKERELFAMSAADPERVERRKRKSHVDIERREGRLKTATERPQAGARLRVKRKTRKEIPKSPIVQMRQPRCRNSFMRQHGPVTPEGKEKTGHGPMFSRPESWSSRSVSYVQKRPLRLEAEAAGEKKPVRVAIENLLL